MLHRRVKPRRTQHHHERLAGINRVRQSATQTMRHLQKDARSTRHWLPIGVSEFELEQVWREQFGSEFPLKSWLTFGIVPTGRSILSITSAVDHGDQVLGQLLRSSQLIDNDTLVHLAVIAR